MTGRHITVKFSKWTYSLPFMPYYFITWKWIVLCMPIASAFITSCSCRSIINLNILSGYWIWSYFQETHINVFKFPQQIKHIYENYRKGWLNFNAWFVVFQLTIDYSEILYQLKFIIVKFEHLSLSVILKNHGISFPCLFLARWTCNSSVI